jgi:peptide-methionine (S)-S-oxide reductase
MSAVLYHDEEQRRLVERDIAKMQTGFRKVHTEVQSYGGMTWAEDYHQKYYLRRHKEAALALKGLTPDYESFVNSTAAMRVNAILGGYLQPKPEELRELGIPEDIVKSLCQPRRSVWQKVGGLLGVI